MPADTPGGRGVSADEHLQARPESLLNEEMRPGLFRQKKRKSAGWCTNDLAPCGPAVVRPPLVPPQAGRGLRAGEALADGSARLLRCAGGVPFDHPEFAPGIGRYLNVTLGKQLL